MGILGADNPYSIVLRKARTETRFRADPQTLTMETVNADGTVIDHLRLRRVNQVAVVVSELRGS